MSTELNVLWSYCTATCCILFHFVTFDLQTWRPITISVYNGVKMLPKSAKFSYTRYLVIGSQEFSHMHQTNITKENFTAWVSCVVKFNKQCQTYRCVFWWYFDRSQEEWLKSHVSECRSWLGCPGRCNYVHSHGRCVVFTWNLVQVSDKVHKIYQTVFNWLLLL